MSTSMERRIGRLEAQHGEDGKMTIFDLVMRAAERVARQREERRQGKESPAPPYTPEESGATMRAFIATLRRSN